MHRVRQPCFINAPCKINKGKRGGTLSVGIGVRKKKKGCTRNACASFVAAYIRIVSLLNDSRMRLYSDIRQFSRRTRWIVAGQVNSGQRPHTLPPLPPNFPHLFF